MVVAVLENGSLTASICAERSGSWKNQEIFPEQLKNLCLQVLGDAIVRLERGRAGDTSHKAYQQLEQYLAGKRTKFDLKLAPKGTAFQQKVWKELLKIPYGQTRSYKELAIAIGRPKAARAVGMALNKNPIPLIIPCHRVIGSNGSLTGFALGLETKRWLLEMEQQT